MPKQPIDYIVPLNMNGLQGRMLRLPARRKTSKEILVVYGHHAMLERWWGLIENLHHYGNVTMPDLPGFGGMDSFRQIGVKPGLDQFADYLAAFIKLRYRHKRIKIVGISYGFVVATRMLQRYPELVKQVDLLVSAIGFAHYDDFRYTTTRRRLYRLLTWAVAHRPIAFLFKTLGLNPVMLRTLYARTYNGRHKFKHITDDTEFDRLMAMESRLWAVNDVTTHMLTANEFLALDNCKAQIALPVEHIYTKSDHYFDTHRVEQHLSVIFSRVITHEAKLDQHVTSVIAPKKDAGRLLPATIRRKLAT